MFPPRLQSYFRLFPRLTRCVTLGVVLALITGDFALVADTLNISTLSGGTVTNEVLGQTDIITNSLTGSGSLLKGGDGVLILGGTGASTFTGDITVNQGALVISGSNQLGAASNILSVTGWYYSATVLGGMAILEGGNSGVTLPQGLTLYGRGGPFTGISAGASFLSLGNNTLTGKVLLGSSATSYGSVFMAGYGNTTLSGPVSLGNPTSSYSSIFNGNGNVIIAGSLSSFSLLTGANYHLQKYASTGITSSLWLQNTDNSFLSPVEIISGNVRVSDGRALGRNTVTSVQMLGGNLEVRADSATLASGTSNFASKSIYLGSTSNIIADRAIGGSSINGTLTMGSISLVAGDNTTHAFSGRNGYSITVGSLGIAQMNSYAPIFTSNLNGLLTIQGNNQFGGTSYGPSFNAVGDILLTGSLSSNVSNSSGFADPISKNNSGLLTFTGTSNSYLGSTNINNGMIQITGFGALNNTGTGGAIQMGNGGVYGALNYTGSADDSTSKLVNLSGTTGGGVLLANQSSGTITFSGGVSASGVGNKSLILAGTSRAANSLSGMIADGTASVTSLVKTQTGTWVYAPTSTATLIGGTGITGSGAINSSTLVVNSTTGIAAGMTVTGGTALGTNVVVRITGNTLWLAGPIATNYANSIPLTFGSLASFTGNVSVSGGTLQIKNALSTTIDVINDQASLNFQADVSGNAGLGRQTAGGVFMYSGYNNSTETVGTLNASAGHAVVSVSRWNAGGSPTLQLGSLGTRSAGATLDFQTPNGSIKVLNGGTLVNGLLGVGSTGWAATYMGTDFATLTANLVDVYTGYTPFSGSPVAGSLNYLVSTSSSTSSAGTMNSLKLTGSGTLTLGGTLALNSGAVLFDNSLGAMTIANNGTNANTLGANGQELIVITNGTAPSNALTISARVGGGATSLTKTGNGLLVLGASNAYIGNTVVNAGTLRLSGGTASIGSPGASSTLVIRQDATFDINGSGTSSLLYAGGTNGPLTTAGVLVGAGVLDNGSSGATAISLGGSLASATGVFTGVISNSAGGSLTVVRNGVSGTQYLTGLNTYTGATVLSGGATLAVTNLANGGTASGIGASSNAASNLVFNGGILQYAGANTYVSQFTQTPSVSTDRLFTLAGNGTIDSSGAYGSDVTGVSSVANNAALLFLNNGSITFSGAGTRNLTLQGSSTGDNEIALKLVDNGTAALSVTKTGSGMWLLSGSNTYSGPTTLSGGILQAQDGTGLSSSSSLTVSGNGILLTSGTFNRALGTGAGQIQFTGAGGFGASSSKLFVNLSSGTINMGTGAFGASTLFLNSTLALADVELQNNINLGTSARILNVDDNPNTTFDFATVSGVISGGTGFSKLGAGNLILSGANTYTGDTTLANGALIVRSIGKIGDASSNLGAGSGSLAFSATGNTLLYVGTGEVSNRPILLSNSAGSAFIDASGSGPLVLSDIRNTTATVSTKALYLRGANTGMNMITSVLADSGTYSLNVTKDNGGTWVLNPGTQNTYSGSTNLNAGNLGLTPLSLSNNTTLNFNGAGIFAYGGSLTNSSTITIQSGITSGANFLGGNSITLSGTIKLLAGAQWALTNFMEPNAMLTFGSITSADTGNTTRTLNLRGYGATTFAGTISDGTASATAVNVTVMNNSAALNAASPFTGGLTLGQGTLILNNATVTPSASVLGAAGGTFGFTGSEMRSNFTLTGASALLNPVWLLGTEASIVSGTSGIEFAGPITINGGNRLLENDINGGPLILSGSLSLSEGGTLRSLYLQGTGNTLVSGGITDGGTIGSSLYYQGTGVLSLTGVNTMTGTLGVVRGVVNMSGTSGGSALTASSLLLSAGGTLVLDDSNGPNGGGRLGTSLPVNSYAGSLQLVGNTSNVTLGTLNLFGATTSLAMSGTGSNSVTFGSLNMASTGASLDLRAVNDLGASNKVLFTGTSGLGLTNGIVPRVFVGSDFATYGGTSGFTAFTATTGTINLNMLGATSNGSLATSSTLTAARTINSLKITGGTVSGAGQTLFLASGGLLATGGTSGINTALVATGTILEVQVTGGSTLNLNAALSASSGLVKAQNGILNLNAANYITGPTVVAAGSLVLNKGLNTLQPGYALTIGQGTLDLNGNAQYTGALSSPGTLPGTAGQIISSGTGGLLVTSMNTTNTFSGQIGGGSTSFGVVGGYDLKLQSPQTYSGRTMRSGAYLYLENNGTLLNTSSIELNAGAALYINGYTSTLQTPNNDRVNDNAPITLRYGAVVLYPVVKTSASETMGTLNSAAGQNTIYAYTANTGGLYGSADLTFAGLNRSKGSIVNFYGTSLGEAGVAGRIHFTNDPTPVAPGILGPWAIANTNDFAGYNQDMGVGPIGQGGYVGYDGLFGTGKITALIATQSGTTTLTSGTVSAMLKIGGAYTNDLAFTGSLDALNLELGGLLRDYNTNATTIGTTTTRGILTAGGTLSSGTQELVVFNGSASNTLTIHSIIKDTKDVIGSGSATVGLVKGGAGTVVLTGSNTYSGGTTVALGNLNLNATTAGTVVIPAGGLTLSNATVTMLTNGSQIASSNAVTINNYATLTLVSSNTLQSIAFNNFGDNSTPTVNTGGTLTLTSTTPVSVNVNQDAYYIPTISGTLSLNSGGTIFVAPIQIDGRTYTESDPSLSISATLRTGTVASIQKEGDGLLRLSGANVFSGSLNVNAGGIIVGATTALGTGTVTLFNGAALLFNGNYTVSNTLYAAGDIKFGGFLSSASLTGAMKVASGTYTVSSPNITITLGGSMSSGTSAIALVKEGLGTLLLSGSNTYAGITTVNSGTLILQGGYAMADTSTLAAGTNGLAQLNTAETLGGLAGSGSINIQSNTLTLSGSSNTSFSGILSGTAPVLKNGSGLQALAGSNTFSGGISVSAGTLAIGSDYALATGSLTMSGGTLSSDSGTPHALANLTRFSGTVGLGSTANTGSLTLAGSSTLVANLSFNTYSPTLITGSLNGAYALTLGGASELTLSGVNTFSGTTTLNSGTLTLNGGNALVDTMTVTGLSAGTLKLAAPETIGTLSGSVSVSLQGGSLTLSGTVSASHSGLISGSGGIVKNVAGAQTFAGSNSFSGGVQLGAGTILAGSDTALGTGTLSFSGGQITSDSNTARAISNGLKLSGTLGFGDATNSGSLLLSGSGILIATSSLNTASPVTLSGSLSGSYGLLKGGSSELTLSGTNTFGGPTTINTGTLTLLNGNALSDSMSVTVNSGGTLKLASSETLGLIAGSGGLNLQANTLTISGTSGSSVFSGLITGLGGSLVLNGNAALTISGSNSFSGGAALNAGTLLLGNNTALGSGTITLTGGTLSSSGTGALSVSNTLLLSNAFTLGNATNNGSLAFSGSAHLASNVSLSAASTVNLGGVIAGTYNLDKAGASELILSGSNTFSGTASVSAGTLTLSGGSALLDTTSVSGLSAGTLKLTASETIAMLGGSPALNLQSNTLTIASTSAGTYSGMITNTAGGRILKTGTGSWTMAGTNTFSAGIQLVQGTLLASNSLALGGGASTLSVTGGTLTSSGTNAIVLANTLSLSGTWGIGDTTNSGAITLSGSATLGGNLAINTYSSGTLSGPLSGAFTLTKGGNAELTLSGTNPNFTGTTTVNTGMLTLAGGNAVSDTSTINGTSSGTLKIATSETIAMLSGSLALNLQSNTLTINSTTSGTYTGAITGANGGVILKSGSGSWTLAGTNSFTSGILLTQGTLLVSNSLSLGGSASTLAATGGTLANTGTGAIVLANTLFLSGTVGLGDATNYGALTLSGSATLGGSLNLNTYSAGTLSGVVSGAYAFSKGGNAELTLSGTNPNFTGNTSINAGTLTLSGGNALSDSTNVDGSGAGTLNLTASETIGMLNGSLALNLQSNTLTISGVSSGTYSGSITNTAGASIVKNGNGVWTLSGATPFSAGVTLNQGSLLVSNSLALGGSASTLTITGGTLASSGTSAVALANTLSLSGTVTLGNSANYGPLAFSGNGALTADTTLATASAALFTGPLNGAGRILTKNGPSTLTLASANTFAGVTLAQGTLLVGDNLALGGSASTFTSTNGTLSSSGSSPISLANALAISGTLGLGDGVNTGSLTLTSGLALNSNLNLNTYTQTTLSGVLSGSYALVKGGYAELTLSGLNAGFAGTTTVNQGTLTLSGGNALADTAPVTGGSAGTLKLNASDTIGLLSGSLALNLQSNTLTINSTSGGTYSGIISSSPGGSILKTGSGAWTLNGTSNFSAGIFLNQGTLLASNDLALGGSASTLTASGGTLSSSGTHSILLANTLSISGTVTLGNTVNTGSLSFNGSSNLAANSTLSTASPVSLNGPLNGAGMTLSKTGGSTLTLNASNTLAGVSLSQGTLLVGNNQALGGSASLFTATGGTLASAGTGAIALANPFLVSGTVGLGSPANFGPLTLSGSGSLTGALTLNVYSPGTLSGILSGTYTLLKGGSSELTLSGLNPAFTGATTVAAGTLTLSGGNALSDNSSVDGAGAGTLKLAASETIGTLGGSLALNLQTNTLTLNANTNSTYSGILTNGAGGGVVKNGSGAFTMAGTNSFSAGITLNEGTLLVSNSLALGGSAATLTMNGGTLASSGTSAVSLANTLSLSGTLGLGDATNYGMLTLSGSVALSGTLSLNTFSQATLSGPVTGAYGLLKAGNADLILSGLNPNFTGPVTVNTGVLTVQGGNALSDTTTVKGLATGTLKLASSETIGMLSGPLSLNLQTNTLTVNGVTNGTFNGTVTSGAGGTIIKSGSGAWTLDGTTNFNAGITLNAGTLLVTNSLSLGAGTGIFTASGGTLASSGTQEILVTNRLSLSGTLGLGDSSSYGPLTLSGSAALGGDFTINTYSPGTLSGALSGSYALTKGGNSELLLSGSNASFTGNTIVNAGTLTLAGGNALSDSVAVSGVGGGTLKLAASETIGTLSGSLAVNIQSNTLSLSGTGSTNFSGLLSGSGNVLKTGSLGTFTLSGANALSGSMGISAGTLALANAGTLTSGTVTVSGLSAILELGATTQRVGDFYLLSGAVQNGSLTANVFTVESGSISSILSGSASFLKNTSGSVLLSGNNNLTGAMNINAGSLLLGGSGKLSSGSLSLNNAGAFLNLGNTTQNVAAFRLTGGTLQNGTLNGTSYALESGIVKATLSDAVAVAKTTQGEVIFSSGNIYGGTLSITDGKLTTSVNDAFNSSANLLLSGGTLSLSTTNQSVSALTLSSGSVTSTGGSLSANSFTLESGYVSANLAGGGALVKNTVGEAILAGSNTYSGGAFLNAGTLTLLTNGGLSPLSNFTLNAGSLSLGSTNQTLGALSLVGGVINGSAGSLSGSAYNVQAGSINTRLVGSGSLTKTSAGEVFLANSNTYSGATSILAGTLTLLSNGALSANSPLVINGGSLALGSTNQTINSLTLNAGTITGSGALTGGSFTLESGSVWTTLAGTGALTKNTGGEIVLAAASTYSGATSVNAGTLRLGVNNALSSLTDIVVNGGELALANTTQRANTLTLNSGSVSGGSLLANAYTAKSGLISSVLTGSGAFTKSGSGTVLLMGANTLSGKTDVSGGTLQLAGAGKIASGSLTISGTSALDLGASTQSVSVFRLTDGLLSNGTLSATTLALENGAVSAVLSGSAAVVKSTLGSVSLSGANTLTGSTDINAGAITLTGAGKIASGSLTLSDSTSLLDLGATTQSVAAFRLSSGSLQNGSLSATSYTLENGFISTVLLGSAALQKNTAGTVVLSGANVLSGSTNVSDGSLVVTGAGKIASGSLSVLSATASLDLSNTSQNVGAFLLANGTLQNGSLTASSYTLQNGAVSTVLKGSAGLVKNTAGTVTLSGSNALSAQTDILAGTLLLSGAGKIASGTLTVTGSASTLAIGSTNQTVSSINLLGGAAVSGTTGALTATGSISVQSGSISAILAGTAALFKTTSGTVTLSGANTYSGATLVTAGTLNLAAPNALSSSTQVTLNAATLSIGANDQSVGKFTLTGGGLLSGDTGVFSAGSFDLSSGSVSAILGGTGTLSKNTTGSVTLSGANIFNGVASINAGTLILTGSSASGGTMFVAAGAMLTGTGATAANVNIASGGLLSPGAATATGKLTLGGLTLTGGANLNFRLNTTSNSDQIGLTNNNGLSLNGNNTLSLSLASGVSLPSLGDYKLISYSGTTISSGLSLSSPILTAGTSYFDTSLVWNASDVTLKVAAITAPSAVVMSGSLSNSGTLSSVDLSSYLDLGSNLVLRATFAGTPYSIQYQWKRNGVALANGTGASYTIANSGTADSGTYQLTVTNIAGSSSVSQSLSFQDLNKALDVIVSSGASVAYSGTLGFKGGVNLVRNGSGNITFPASVAIPGSLTYSGSTTTPLLIPSTNLSSATRTLYQGSAASALTFGPASSFALGTSGGTLIAAAAAPLTFGGSINGSGTLTLNANSTGSILLSGSISNSGEFNNAGTGTGLVSVTGAILNNLTALNQASATSQLLLGTLNSYSGPTTVKTGSLLVTADGALGSTASGTTVNPGATLDFQSVSYSAQEPLTLKGGSLSSSVGVNSFAGPVALTTSVSAIQVNSTSLSLSGALSGNGGFAKSGPGTLYLSGANTGSGPISLNAGVLAVSSANGLGTGPVSLAAGTTLQLNVASGMTLAGPISGAGNIVKSGNGVLNISGANNGTGSLSVTGGTVNVVNGGKLGAGPINIGAGCTLVYYLSQDTTISNTITGSGNVLSGNPAYRLTWSGGAVGGPTPTFTCPSSANANVQVPFTYQVSANNGPNVFKVTNLPAGLSFNSSTGIISGVLATAGEYQVSLSATNPGGTSNFTLTIQSSLPTPAITSNPSSVKIPLGGSGVMTAKIFCRAAFKYRWRKVGVYADIVGSDGIRRPDPRSFITPEYSSQGGTAPITINLTASSVTGSAVGLYALRAYIDDKRFVETAPAILSIDVGTPKIGISKLLRAGIAYDLSKVLNYAIVDLAGAQSSGIYKDEIFELGVTTDPTATYAWSYAPLTPGSLVPIRSQTSSVFNFGAADVPKTPGYFQIVVNNGGKTTTIRFRVLKFNPNLGTPLKTAGYSLNFFAKPASFTVNAGGIANFWAGVNGMPSTFSWWKEGANGNDTLISRGASPFLTISPVSMGSAGKYYVVVDDPYNNQINSMSAPAVLTVTPAGE